MKNILLDVLLSREEFAQLRPPSAVAGLHDFTPLKIQDAVLKDSLVGYQAPWDDAQCKNALATTNIYQAGANIVWVKPIATASSVPASGTASRSQVVHFANMYFTRDSAKAHVQRDGRIVFPTILETFCDAALRADPALQAAGAAEAVPARAGPILVDGGMHLLGGHALVQAWWVSMARALAGKDFASVAALWQCGLTVTVLLRSPTCRAELVQHSLKYSESLRLQERCLTDNFLSFADKLAALVAPAKLQASCLGAFQRDSPGKFIGARATEQTQPPCPVGEQTQPRRGSHSTGT